MDRSQLDILAIGVHPDDVELSCSGTLLKHLDLGYTCGILDLTQGELGTRGNAELRLKEAKEAASIMNIQYRKNAGLPDGFFLNDRESKLTIIRYIRECRPQIVLANTVRDRHPDHGRAATLTSEACFLSGLRKIETSDEEGKAQEHWRPSAVYHYIQDYALQVDLVVDITGYIDRKMETIRAFSSQFFNPSSKEPSSPISGQDFMDFIVGRAHTYGRQIGVDYGEGFIMARPVGCSDMLKLI